LLDDSYIIENVVASILVIEAKSNIVLMSIFYLVSNYYPFYLYLSLYPYAVLLIIFPSFIICKTAPGNPYLIPLLIN